MELAALVQSRGKPHGIELVLAPRLGKESEYIFFSLATLANKNYFENRRPIASSCRIIKVLLVTQ